MAKSLDRIIGAPGNIHLSGIAVGVTLVPVPSSVFGGRSSDGGFPSRRGSNVSILTLPPAGPGSGGSGSPAKRKKKTLTFAPMVAAIPEASAVPARDPRMVGVSTVAKQIQRRREAEIQDLELARRARQSKECTVLDYQVKSRRDQLKRLLARSTFLQEENLKLAEEIIRIESGAMGRVHSDLQQTVNTAMSGQTLNRQFQRDVSHTQHALGCARANNEAAIRDAAARNKEIDLRANQEATALKELLAYRRRGLTEDEKYKARLVIRLETTKQRLAQDLERKIAEMEDEVKTYRLGSQDERDAILSRATDQTVAAMDSTVMSTAAINVDIREELAIQTRVTIERKHTIRKLRGEQAILKAQLAAVDIARGQRQGGAPEFGMLPSRIADPPNADLLAKMRNLASLGGYE